LAQLDDLEIHSDVSETLVPQPLQKPTSKFSSALSKTTTNITPFLSQNLNDLLRNVEESKYKN